MGWELGVADCWWFPLYKIWMPMISSVTDWIWEYWSERDSCRRKSKGIGGSVSVHLKWVIEWWNRRRLITCLSYQFSQFDPSWKSEGSSHSSLETGLQDVLLFYWCGAAPHRLSCEGLKTILWRLLSDLFNPKCWMLVWQKLAKPGQSTLQGCSYMHIYEQESSYGRIERAVVKTNAATECRY